MKSLRHDGGGGPGCSAERTEERRDARADRGRGPRGADRGDHAAAPRRPVLVVERRPDAAVAAPGDRDQPPHDGAGPVVGPRGRGACRRVEVEWRMWVCTHARAGRGRHRPPGSASPSRAESEVLSPTAPACVPQDHLERVLLDHLRRDGRRPGRARRRAGRARRTARTGVRAIVRDVGDRSLSSRPCALRGRGRRRARARARVLGIAARRGRPPLRGRVDPVPRAVVGRRRPAPLRHLLDRPIRRRRARSSRPAATAGSTASSGTQPTSGSTTTRSTRLAQLLRLATGVAELEPLIERDRGATFGAFMAERSGTGSAFLVGDAAHR